VTRLLGLDVGDRRIGVAVADREGHAFPLTTLRRTDDPERDGAAIAALVRDLRSRTGCVVTHGYGPRYLHSTGQLHKGGPNTGLFLQVVDDPGEELPIPDKPFGFRRLIRAQAAGDYESLKERGRRVARIHIEEA